MAEARGGVRYLAELIDFLCTVEQDGAGEQLGDDAARAPHVDSGCVHFGAKEQLRRAVPAAHVTRRLRAGSLEQGA